MDFSGAWRIVSSDDFSNEELQIEVAPYLNLQQTMGRVEGHYHVGLQTGTIDGRLQTEDQFIFSFAGVMDSEVVNGAGSVTRMNDRLIFTLMYHMRDDYTFECEL